MRIAPTSTHAPSPEGRVMDTYLDELSSLLGVGAIGYNRATNPGELRVAFESRDFAKLADNTLRDAVLGVKLVFTAPDGTPYDLDAPGAAWTSRAASSARLIAAMPGVVSHTNLGDAMVYLIETKRVRDELAALVNPAPNGLLAIWNFAHGTPPAR